MRMTELRALARDHEQRGYFKLRKAELIAFLQNNEHQAQRRQRPPPPPTDVHLGTKSTSTNVYLGTGM